MARLVYIEPDGKERVKKLRPQKGDIIVGRNMTCSIYTNNLSVSRNHGKFFWENGHYVYVDLGSINGTQINDKPVKRAILKDSDVIKCGDFIIRFYEDEDDSKKTLPEEKIPREIIKPKVEQREEKPYISQEHFNKLIKEKDKEIDRLSKELDNLRQELIKVREEEAHKIGDRESFADIMVKTKKEKQEYEAQIKNLQNIIEEGERKISELETRNVRISVEMDSITEKYVQLKDQIYHQNKIFGETKLQLQEKDDIIFEFEQKLKDSERQLQSIREKISEQNELISNFKIKITHKDREIEDLKRQLDLTEYELRALREENENLQSSFNKDGGVQAELERKCNLLREVIAEKENVISELRLELEEKDKEIREVRMGVGITDLEEEKKKILMDYYQKNRELDELKDKIKNIEFERNETIRKLDETKAEIENLKSQKEDIFIHPEYKKKVREVEKIKEEKITLEEELSKLQKEISLFNPAEKARLERELEILRRKNVTLGEQLQTATREVQSISDIEIFNKYLIDFGELISQWKGNLSVLKSFLEDTRKLFNAMSTIDEYKLPPSLKSFFEDGMIEDLSSSMDDILKILGKDIDEIEKNLGKFHALFP